MAKFNLTIKKKIFFFIILNLIFIVPNLPNAIDNINDKSVNFIDPNIDSSNLNNRSEQEITWSDDYSKLDKNKNGISDDLENKINENPQIQSSKKQITALDLTKLLTTNKNTENQIDKDNISIIVKFSKAEFNDPLSLFRKLGGKIKSVYSKIIYGFAGSIDYNKLIEFARLLKLENFEFYIEEDGKGESTLYYTGLNMNLRPYVWNTLGYNGDENGAIAILDSGLDDSHSMLEGYSSGNFNNKIVGWHDFVGSSSTPYDDNGHGSHCGGIAAGDGSPNLDTYGRTVSSDGIALEGGGPYAEQTVQTTLLRFNVTEPGTIDVELQHEDSTIFDDLYTNAYLYYESTQVDSIIATTNKTWLSNMSYDVTVLELGNYEVVIELTLVDDDYSGAVEDPNFGFRARAHWPFNPPDLGEGDLWKGVASDTHLVGGKVANYYGGVYQSDVVDALTWCVNNKNILHITTISISLGWITPQTSIIDACNWAVENGIVVVVAAGNEGTGGYGLTSPGDADKVITVAANNVYDQITEYSGEGELSYTGATYKPDITAPGGSTYALQIFSTDSDDNDAEGIFSDWYEDDLAGMQGTSMATPAVAGASNLLIEAMGGYNNWNYTEQEALKVKSLLLMTATETAPLLRENSLIGDSPTLNRGNKDIHEGYGRINIDMAIEAYTQSLDFKTEKNFTIASSDINPFNKHGFACNAYLLSGVNYTLELNVPSGCDFDLYIYDDNPTAIGDPIIEQKSISSTIGGNESISFIPSETGLYYIVVKAVSGQGEAYLSFKQYAHDIAVSISAPSTALLADKFEIILAIENIGTSDETDVSFVAFVNNEILDSRTFSSFSSGQIYQISFRWSPSESDQYNLTTISNNVTGEINLGNNIKIHLVNISSSAINNYEMQVDYPYSWIDTSGGTELNLGDDDADTVLLPFLFPFYNMTFTEVYVSSNGYLSFFDSYPINQYEDDFPSGDLDNWFLIAPFWTDLDPTESGAGPITFDYTSDYLAITWNNIYTWGSYSGSLIGTFQVVLYRYGDIIFNYDYIQNTHISHSCGLNFGVDTRFFNDYNNHVSRNDFSIRFTNDTMPPTWLSQPGEITAYYGQDFIYHLLALDSGGIRNYWISDLENFDIDENGRLTNYTFLPLDASYPLEIRAYDYSDHYSSLYITINIREAPSNASIPGYQIAFLIAIIGFSIILISIYKRKKIKI
ncbi:MAG: S8 family serine peptidase [Candidatus Lokiarchaeota archaeon]|nr:S8 family serine peptidase [Candidatus Lokiarchaeota archaeon]